MLTIRNCLNVGAGISNVLVCPWSYFKHPAQTGRIKLNLCYFSNCLQFTLYCMNKTYYATGYLCEGLANLIYAIICCCSWSSYIHLSSCLRKNCERESEYTMSRSEVKTHNVDERSIWRAINFIFNELMTNRKWKYRNIKLWQQNVDQLWLIKMFQLQVFLNSSEKFIGRCFFSDVCCGKNERQSCWRQACTWKIAPETGERKLYLDFKKILQN